MDTPTIITPSSGSRIVKDDKDVILFSQPPEVLKGLLLKGITHFDTLVLPDVCEKNGSLMNNLEFPLYFFLFIADRQPESRKINLVGKKNAISQALRLLRFTLHGPTTSELERWHTAPGETQEWRAVSDYLALKNKDGAIISVEDFFEQMPFIDDRVTAGRFTIEHTGSDQYKVSNSGGAIDVDLNTDQEVSPPYQVPMDYIPGGQTKFGIEVLGGASGFATNEPCTGIAVCYNGDYILIDSIPFLNQHLYARGISKNQVSAVFLTHLHDDHCSMFPLLEMPHRVEIITTEQIYHMAIEKLSCGLGWSTSTIEQHFTHIEIKPGETIDYYGMAIKVHTTVHSIPTIGATFSTCHRGQYRDVCIVGDNQNMPAVEKMCAAGVVRKSTLETLQSLYTQNFHLLIADGGAGAIHGDPNDALQSQADRVVFVHVDELPESLNTTFSLASAGKRYTLFEGNDSIYTSQINHYLNQWLGRALPTRWMQNLLSEHEISRYNTEDVIIVQGTSSKGSVYLILTGYCEVVHHDGEQRHSLATLQTGDIIGEMAVLTGSGIRNASVVARTPVTVAAFNEDIFRNFIQHSGQQEQLENRWSLRPAIKQLAQFSALSSTVADRIAGIGQWLTMNAGDSLTPDSAHLYIFSAGNGEFEDIENNSHDLNKGDEFGWRPFGDNRLNPLKARSECRLIMFERDDYVQLLESIPQFNYQTRKRIITEDPSAADWLLGRVNIYDD